MAKDAKAKGEEIHMARAHGICVEKHSQLPVGDPKRKFKGRGVLLGNQVKNQSFEAAMFQDLGNSPASFDVHAAGSDKEMTFGKNFMNRCFPKLLQQQKDVLLEWEAMLCEPADAERLAAQPAIQRQLDRLVAVLERRFEEFAALRPRVGRIS